MLLPAAFSSDVPPPPEGLVSHSDLGLVSHLSSSLDSMDLLFRLWLCRLPRAGFKRWFSLSSHHHRFFSGGLQGARPGMKAYCSLKNQVSTVVLVGPAVPIHPNLQLMLDMTALAGWVSHGLASPCPFPAPWRVNSPTITGSSYLNEGEKRVLFFSGAEFPSSETMYY